MNIVRDYAVQGMGEIRFSGACQGNDISPTLATICTSSWKSTLEARVEILLVEAHIVLNYNIGKQVAFSFLFFFRAAIHDRNPRWSFNP